jgi:Mn-dependent DtxR family transcriptional regulator
MSTEANNEVITLLAKEWDLKGPPGIMDISDIVAALPLAPSETLAALRELYTQGLIDMNKFKTSAFLTPEGYDAVASDKKE